MWKSFLTALLKQLGMVAVDAGSELAKEKLTQPAKMGARRERPPFYAEDDTGETPKS